MEKRLIIEQILIKEDYNGIIPIQKLLDVISKEKYSLKELFSYNAAITKFTKDNFPDKPRTNIKLCTWLLSKYGFKYCSKCKQVKLIEEFSNNNAKSFNKNTWCKVCFSKYQKENPEIWRNYSSIRRAKTRLALPKWQNIQELYLYYKNCPSGYEVDHIIPLNNTLVCGLHCMDNLQYLTIEGNREKSNKLEA